MKIIINLILILNFLQSITGAQIKSQNYFNKESLKYFIDFIKSRVDLTADPCTDFSKYACHNVKEGSRFTKYYPNQMESYVSSLFVEGEPQNEIEIKVRDMYLSCLKEFHDTGNDTTKRIQNIFKQISDLKFITNGDKNEITSKDIANILFKLFHLDNPEIPFEFDTSYDEDAKEYNSKITSKRNVAYDTDIKDILTAANFVDGIEEIIKLDRKIVDISKKIIQKLPESDAWEDLITVDISKLPEYLPFNNMNWADFYDNFQNEYNIKIAKIKIDLIGTPEVLAEIDSNNKRTIMNYLTYKYIKGLLKIDCKDYVINDDFYRIAVYARIWDDNFQHNGADRTIKVLDDFRSHIDSIKNKVKPNDLFYIEPLYEKWNSNRKLYESWNKSLPFDLRERLYNNYKIDKNEFYTNVIQIYKYYSTKSIKNNLNPGDIKKIFVFETNFDNQMMTLSKNRPYIDLYSTFYNDLWYNVIMAEIYSESSTELTRAPYSDERVKLLKIIREYPAQFIPYRYFESVSQDHTSGLHKEKELIETKYSDNGLWNFEKLYFIASAQRKCEEPRMEVSKNAHLFQIIQNLDGFSKAFNCPTNSISSEFLEKYEKRCKEITTEDNEILPLCSKDSYNSLFV